MSVSNESSWRYAGWRVACASALGVFVSFGSLLVFTFGVFLKPIAAEFGWSRESVSSAFGIAALAVALCSPAIGMLVDRHGARRMILPCITVFSAAFASLGLLTGKLGALYGTFLVLGIVGNGTTQLAYAGAVAGWFTRRRGLAMAVLLTGSATGAMLWPPIAQSLVDGVGWRRAAFVLGAAAAIGGWVAGLLVRDNPSHSRPARGRRSGEPVLRMAATRPFLVIVAVLFLSSLGQNGAIVHLSALLTDRGVSPEGAALAVSTLGAAALAGRFAAGFLLDRYFAPRVAMTLLGIAASGVLVIAGARSAAVGALGAALVGVGMGAEADITPYLLSRYFGLHAFSTLYGLTWSAYAVAGALGPVLMGRAFDLSGSYSSFLTGLAALMLVAAALTLALPAYEREAIGIRTEAEAGATAD
jgi:MFS family permease